MLHHPGISADRDPLIQRIEIIIVKGKPNRQPFDDKRRQLMAGTSPLLLCVSLDQLLVNIHPDQPDRLLLQIGRLGDTGRLPLLLDLRLCLLRGDHAPHPVKGIHIEGQ